MKDLLKLAVECMNELDAIGVKYGNVVEWKVNTRAKKRWGQCRYRISTNDYSINISNELLADNVSDRAVKDTIFHELIHTVDGCMNHGIKWQNIADLVNDCYGYNIKRCTSENEKGVKLTRTEKIYKYQFVCLGCGQTIKRQKMSEFVKNYHNYRCGKCNGKFAPISSTYVFND